MTSPLTFIVSLDRFKQSLFSPMKSTARIVAAGERVCLLSRAGLRGVWFQLLRFRFLLRSSLNKICKSCAGMSRRSWLMARHGRCTHSRKLNDCTSR